MTICDHPEVCQTRHNGYGGPRCANPCGNPRSLLFSDDITETTSQFAVAGIPNKQEGIAIWSGELAYEACPA
ncbi:hypothetical protein AN191_12175 [Loktanella sp. 5RATIMAR09]|nr:hypothetical protein AN191_12175 [Loktanella sp. 5RATIMAR09]